MKIALVTGDLNFSELKIWDLYNKYLSKKFELKLFCYGYKKVPIEIKSNNIYIFMEDKNKFISEINEFNPDVIHFQRPATSSNIIKELLKIDSIFIETLHFDVWDSISYKINHHVVVSKFLLYFLIKRFKLLDYINNFSVIPNPVDAETIINIINENKNEMKGKKESLIDGEEILIGLVARPDPVKTYTPIFAKALKKLFKKRKSCRFIAIGGIPLSFKKEVHELIKDNKIVDIGPMYGEDLYKHLACLDIYTWFSVQGETFGIAIAEAMSTCLPVVVNGTPWTPNAQTLLVRNNYNGFVANSISGWVDAIGFLIENPDLRRKFGERGQKLILEYYHPIKTFIKIANLYEELVEGTLSNKISKSDYYEIKREFIKNKKNIFDAGIKYSIDRTYTMYLCRKFIAGNSNSAILRALIDKIIFKK